MHAEPVNGYFRLTLVLAGLFLCLTGCRSRGDYARMADADAYGLISQKSCDKPWSPPPGFSLYPAASSRLAVEGCYVRPCLPSPTTSLYAYNLPLLRSDFQASEVDDETGEQEEPEEPLGRPLPPAAWKAIPAACLNRMVDFDSIRSEATYTEANYDARVLAETTSDARKLTLEDVVELAVLNSREYQTQKENLYLFALQLSAERFDYQRQFRRTGNGFSLGFDHERFGGITENSLSIPSGVGVSRALVTGGDVLATFANNILLTFNGPSGFSKQISSAILLNYAQPLIQRDIRFESLTQAERNVVYAARDFARFRREFFVSFASDYYDLIRSFRQIEIDSQNYFSLVRAFNQAEQEFLAEQVPRFQVDQVEQNLLSGRGRLIGTCNQVEQALDSLKLSLGIPTETPINVDLQELNELTRLDQLSVATDSAERVLARLRTALKKPDRLELVSTSAVLLDRIVNAAELVTESNATSEVETFLQLRQQYLVDLARLISQQILRDLNQELESISPRIPILVRRSLEHCETLIQLVERQIDYAATLEGEEAEIATFESKLTEYAAEFDELTILGDEVRIGEQESIVDRARPLRRDLSALIGELDDFLGISTTSDPAADLARIEQGVIELINRAEATLDQTGFGLKPIELEADDAMITAVLLRFDLMNQRESLADDWRQIKLAADNLKAIIDINATQIINTDRNTDDPFNFTFDDSSTSLGLTVDAPLNRFLERNAFRATLIDYQRALRNLTQLEDNIKFAVRNDLRNLALDREQYLIAVASAALAYERVVSTSLEFRLSTGGVTARDFLEAQTAYIEALSNVASRHIEYIVDRSQLFLDLEQLIVDDNGFWPEIRNESGQPETVYSLPSWAFPVYGKLPCVCYSDEVKQMLCVPVTSAVPPNAMFMPDGTTLPEFMSEVDTSDLESSELNASKLDAPVVESSLDANIREAQSEVDQSDGVNEVRSAEEIMLPDPATISIPADSGSSPPSELP